jgi:hypothetical protein
MAPTIQGTGSLLPYPRGLLAIHLYNARFPEERRLHSDYDIVFHVVIFKAPTISSGRSYLTS